MKFMSETGRKYVLFYSHYIFRLVNTKYFGQIKLTRHTQGENSSKNNTWKISFKFEMRIRKRIISPHS